MITLRKSNERGHANHGWLDSHHTFSFAGYQDPKHMGFRTLRVINEDRVAPSEGFGTHGHADMEIISYVVAGKLAHKDSMGSGSVLERGDVQVMSAGTGMMHSEFNGSANAPVHFLQIWILPDARRHTPRYAEKRFADADKRDALKLLVGPDGGKDAPLTIHQDARLYASVLGAGKTLEHRLAPGRSAWVQVVTGALSLNGAELTNGDGASVSDEALLKLEAKSESEFLLFDLA
jgi:redox-sensitive bicupin YhaK (pirin superfamily)